MVFLIHAGYLFRIGFYYFLQVNGSVCPKYKINLLQVNFKKRKGMLFFMINNASFTHIFRTYKPITTYDQRCQYKRDFQSEYPEYIELKKNVDTVTRKFIELDRSWRRTEKGSEDYFVRKCFQISLLILSEFQRIN